MKLRFPSAITIVLGLTIIVASMSFIVPSGYYKYLEPSGEIVSHIEKSGDALPIAGSYESTGIKKGMGLMEFLKIPLMGFFSAQSVVLLVIVLGGFINIGMQSGAINGGISALVSKTKGREKLMFPVLVVVFGLQGSLYAAGEELVAFYPLLIPIMLTSGYDKLTAMAIIYCGAIVGVMASTVNPFNIGIASNFSGITMGDGMILRWVIFFALMAITTLFISRYAAKIKADPTKSLVYDSYEADRKRYLGGNAAQNLSKSSMTLQQKLILTIFIATFGATIYGVIPFSEIGMPFLPTLDWWFDELTVCFFVGAILMAIVGRLSEATTVQRFLQGSSEFLPVALIIGVARGIKIALETGGIDETILHWGEMAITGLTSYAFVAGVFFLETFLSFFIPSSSGLAAFTIPIITPLANFAEVHPSFMVIAYAAGNGFAHLFIPSAAILMVGLTYNNISYNKWIRFVWPLLVQLVIAELLILTVSMMLFN